MMVKSAAGDSETRSRLLLVGVDSSLNGRIALEHAGQRAGAGGRLVVAHVVRPQDAVVATSAVEVEPDRRVIAQQLVDGLAGDVEVETTPVVLEGSPAERLAQEARERGADEIIVGSRGLGRFAAALGSVSHALLQQVDRPVVVVPRAVADRPRDTREQGSCVVIVGFDGSPPSRAALAYAAHRASPAGRVVAVHAFQPAPDWLGLPSYRNVVAANQAHGQELLQALEEEDIGTELETTLLEGPPARAIVAAADARDADEIVVGSRGFGPVRGMLGSLSHALLHETDRVVVIIPADAVA
jgi:nucleotide-binding universal stress UspA family protein